MSNVQTKVTSSHWGAFKVTTEDGRITGVSSFEADPDPSKISESIPAAVYHRTRVARPSIRKGWLAGTPEDRATHLRGKDEFVELPWDEALDIAAAEIERVRQIHGNGSIFGGSYGWSSAGTFHHARLQLWRFLNSAGGFVSTFASYSTGAAQALIPHVLGMEYYEFIWHQHNSWEMISENTETLVMFGGINPKNSQVSMGGVTKHETKGWLEKFAEEGMRLVNISPLKTDAYAGAEWLPVIPGSDTALMLGLAYVIETGGMVDQDFIGRCTVGYDRFRAYLLGETDGVPKTPEWASAICGIPAEKTQELAQHMGKTRTLITVAWSLQRAQNGEQPFWMATTLAAMLGQIGLPGGGIGFGYGAIGGVGVPMKPLGRLGVPFGENAISDVIPVARIADLLLNPNQPYDFNGEKKSYADIRLVYWCGGNPFHHHQDLNRLNEAFQRPETIMVNEPWWTATAQRADFVFPATTPYEREDIGRASSDSFLFHMPKFIDPVDEARDDYDIFAALAERLNCGDTFTEGRSSGEWTEFLYERFVQDAMKNGVKVPVLEELREANWTNLPIAGRNHTNAPFELFRNDPEGASLATPSGKIELFSEKIDSFGYDDCLGHASWLAPDEWLGSVGTAEAREYPLHMVSPQPGDKLHSQMESALADRPGARPMPVTMNLADAERRGISDKDLVQVFNGRGKCLARADLSTNIRPGVIALSTGAWYSLDEDGTDVHGNPNVLTRDVGTSKLGQGTSAHTTLVDIRKVGNG
ncbi:MAG: biotin/methionine sulfoxide reductase [Cellvibrionaceae bacterium]|jgi:biotin/methionine sulfoxide reductase